MANPKIKTIVDRLIMALVQVLFSTNDMDLGEVAEAFTKKISGKKVQDLVAEFIHPTKDDASQQTCGGNSCPFFEWEYTGAGSAGVCKLNNTYVINPSDSEQNRTYYKHKGTNYTAHSRTKECMKILPFQKK